MNPDQQLAQAAQYQLEGDLGSARKIYQALLQLDNNHFTALANLASINVKTGNLKQATALYRRALRIDETVPELWFNYANLCQKQKDFETAESSFRKALAISPDLPPGWFNLGNLLRDQGALDEAEVCYRKTIELAPKFPRAYTNLGNILRKGERCSEAVDQHLLARQLDPGNADICLNLGNALTDLNRFSEAATRLREGLTLSPRHEQIQLALGRLLILMGKESEAIQFWLELLNTDPHHADALLNLGILYFQLKDNDKAVMFLRKAARQAPARLDVMSQLGFTLTELGQISEAQQIAEKLVTDHPDAVRTHMLLGFVAVQDARIADGLEAFAKIRELDPGDGIGVSNACFGSLYADFHNATQVTQIHRDMSARVVEAVHAQPIKARQQEDGERIRIGYLSPDFRSHPVGFFLEPILQNHDRNGFELFGYGIQSSIDDMGRSLIAHLDHWHHCASWSDARLIEQIRSDQLDILVDLGGYTANCKMNVLARRVAPVQVIYLGYPCTTGMPEMDYIIGDHQLIPPGLESLYTERPARLDTSFLCFQPRPNLPQVAPLPSQTNGYVTFGSYSNLPKLSDRCIRLWAEVLKATPTSRLLLKAMAFSDTDTRERVWDRFCAVGINKERVSLSGPTIPIQKFMAEYGRIDIALDTVPYNGGTTTCDALWMGVPVVSLSGQHFYERMGASILTTLGRPDWVANDEPAYVGIATRLASDIEDLNKVRQKLRMQMQSSVLCDGVNFTRGLERQYRFMLK